jgi:hypothetical protein
VPDPGPEILPDGADIVDTGDIPDIGADIEVDIAPAAEGPCLVGTLVTHEWRELAVGAAAFGDGVVVAGRRSTQGEEPAGAWLGRYDTRGEIIEHHGFGTDDSTFFAVIVEGDDQLALVGRSVEVNAEPVGWLVRTDGEGEVLSEKTWAGDGVGWFHAAAARPGGGLALVGRTHKAGSSADGWLLLTDEAGSVEYDRRYGESHLTEALEAVIALKDETGLEDGYAMAGNVTGAGNPGEWYFVRTDHLGIAFVLEVIPGGSEQDVALDLTQDAAGQFVLVGKMGEQREAGVVWLNDFGQETGRLLFGQDDSAVGVTLLPNDELFVFANVGTYGKHDLLGVAIDPLGTITTRLTWPAAGDEAGRALAVGQEIMWLVGSNDSDDVVLRAVSTTTAPLKPCGTECCFEPVVSTAVEQESTSGLVATPDGFVQAGALWPGLEMTDSPGLLIGYDSRGKQTFLETIDPGPDNARFWQVGRIGDGLIGLGHQAKPGFRAAWAAITDDKGKLLVDWTVDDPTGNTDFRAVAPRPEGGVLLAGNHWRDSVSGRVFTVVVEADGSMGERTDWMLPGSRTEVTSLITTKAGYAGAGRAVTAPGPGDMYLLVLDAAGSLVHHARVGLEGTSEDAAGIAVVDDGYVLVGGVGDPSNPIAVYVDALGVETKRVPLTDGGGYAYSVTSGPTGRLWVAGKGTNPRTPWVRPLDGQSETVFLDGLVGDWPMNVVRVGGALILSAKTEQQPWDTYLRRIVPDAGATELCD